MVREQVFDILEEEKQQHSVVLVNLPESNKEKANERVKEDAQLIEEILDVCDVECKPNQVYRMGKQLQGRARLIKIELPTKFLTKKFLKNKSLLKNVPKFNKLFLRPSLSKSQRIERSRLINLCKSMRTQNPNSDFVVYADHVISAKDIPIYKNDPTKYKCVCHSE
uniref:Uncharacterized protein n=1 Tax=Meloidogyne hapla TaxID=6305 RepID=A0A1I8BGS8_MELHA